MSLAALLADYLNHVQVAMIYTLINDCAQPKPVEPDQASDPAGQ
jgi:hypothetical protein